MAVGVIQPSALATGLRSKPVHQFKPKRHQFIQQRQAAHFGVGNAAVGNLQSHADDGGEIREVEARNFALAPPAVEPDHFNFKLTSRELATGG